MIAAREAAGTQYLGGFGALQATTQAVAAGEEQEEQGQSEHDSVVRDLVFLPNASEELKAYFYHPALREGPTATSGSKTGVLGPRCRSPPRGPGSAPHPAARPGNPIACLAVLGF